MNKFEKQEKKESWYTVKFMKNNLYNSLQIKQSWAWQREGEGSRERGESTE